MNNTTAFILAGGNSSRMGTDKGVLLFRGKPLVQHVIDELSKVFSEIVIVSNNPDYTQFGLEVIPDTIKGVGPLGGILSGLKYSNSQWNFFTACDMPFISEKLIRSLNADKEDSDAVVPFHDLRYEPLCAFYHKKVYGLFYQQALEGNYSLNKILSGLNVKKVNISEESLANDSVFENFNYRSDLTKFETR